MSTEKRRLIFKAFIISQFNYCPLVWMFHTKQLNNRINSLCLSSPIMSDIFSLSENGCYNRRFGVTVNRRNIRTNKFGFETVSTIRAIPWNDLPAKNAESLKIFKQKIKVGAQMIVAVKYVENSQKIWVTYNIKNQKKKKIK